jgi:hypothetical protein
MSEDLLKGLLHDILGVLSRARNASRNEENPLLVSPTKISKAWPSPLLAATTSAAPSRGRANEGNVPQSCFVNLVYDFG